MPQDVHLNLLQLLKDAWVEVEEHSYMSKIWHHGGKQGASMCVELKPSKSRED